MDETAYKMHHALTPEWPSLTLEIIHLGDHRTRLPHTVTMVVGSQADEEGRNKINVLRMSDLSRIPGSVKEKTEKELDDEMLGEEWKNKNDEENESDEEDGMSIARRKNWIPCWNIIPFLTVLGDCRRCFSCPTTVQGGGITLKAPATTASG